MVWLHHDEFGQGAGLYLTGLDARLQLAQQGFLDLLINGVLPVQIAIVHALVLSVLAACGTYGQNGGTSQAGCSTLPCVLGHNFDGQ